MKTYFKIVIIISLITLGCKSKKPEVKSDDTVISNKTQSMLKILDNTSLDLRIDPIGSLYHELIHNEEFLVVSYRYEENTAEDIMDGHYIEEILFQLKKPVLPDTITHTKLADNRAIFNRQCFCKGEAGTFLITEGTLILEENKKGYQFKFDFTIHSGKQITKNISGNIPKN